MEHNCCKECFLPERDGATSHSHAAGYAMPEGCKDEDCPCHTVSQEKADHDCAFDRVDQLAPPIESWDGWHDNSIYTTTGKEMRDMVASARAEGRKEAVEYIRGHSIQDRSMGHMLHVNKGVLDAASKGEI